MDDFLKKKIILTNKLSIILAAFFLIIASIMLFNFHFVINSVILLMLVTILMSIPLLNRSKFSNFGPILLSLILPVFIFAASTSVKLRYELGKEIIFYFLPLSSMVITVIIPLFVLDFKDKLQFYLTMAFYIFSILIYNKVHDLLGIGIENAILPGNSYYLASLIPLLNLLIIAISFIFMQKMNLAYEQTLLKKNKELEDSGEK